MRYRETKSHWWEYDDETRTYTLIVSDDLYGHDEPVLFLRRDCRIKYSIFFNPDWVILTAETTDEAMAKAEQAYCQKLRMEIAERRKKIELF